jgi:hypothetical protein
MEAGARYFKEAELRNEGMMRRDYFALGLW